MLMLLHMGVGVIGLYRSSGREFLPMIHKLMFGS